MARNLIKVRIIGHDGKRRTLRKSETEQFLQELNNVKIYMPTLPNGILPSLASDCLITIHYPHFEEEYEIFGNSVLYEVSSNKSWQFWFGLMLLRWLYPN